MAEAKPKKKFIKKAAVKKPKKKSASEKMKSMYGSKNGKEY